jgi:hypothetical protein
LKFLGIRVGWSEATNLIKSACRDDRKSEGVAGGVGLGDDANIFKAWDRSHGPCNQSDWSMMSHLRTLTESEMDAILMDEMEDDGKEAAAAAPPLKKPRVVKSQAKTLNNGRLRVSEGNRSMEGIRFSAHGILIVLETCDMTYWLTADELKRVINSHGGIFVSLFASPSWHVPSSAPHPCNRLTPSRTRHRCSSSAKWSARTRSRV